MGDPLEKELVLDEIFSRYDVYRTGELSPEQLQAIHSDMRVGGISIPQIQESIKYNCIGDCCERSELFDVLQEMDRRYYLIQDFRWEFSLLDTQRTDTITETQARWFVEMVHGKYFSNLKWERFLRQRAVPSSGVTFPEIEVTLCNIPSREDWLADQDEERREREEQERQRRDLERMIDEEKDKRRRQRDEDRKRKEEADMKRRLDEDRRNREEEDERRQRQREKEDATRRKRELEEEEERGQREAEERERNEKEQKNKDEKLRKEKEEQELARLIQLEEQHRKEEEERRKQELQEASDYEAILKDATRKELEAASEAEKQRQRKEGAVDEMIKKEADEAEQRAILKRKEYRNKRIRYNLKVAIKLRDRDRLMKSVNEFKKARLPDDDNDLPKAEKLLREFQARDGLKRAMKGRKLQPLEQAISFVKRNGFELTLERELIEAHKVLLQLRRLERIRAEILELKQATVAEIRSYQKPPPVVHIVMTGTFLLLGHKEKETKDWKNVQALVGKTGKEGLKRRCLECNPSNINPDAGRRAKALLGQFELDEVRDVSAGAATFYLWSWTMIEEAEAQQIAMKEEAAERKRQQEEKKRKKKEQQEKQEQQRAAAAAAAAASGGSEQDDDPPKPPATPVTPRDVTLVDSPQKSPRNQPKSPQRAPSDKKKSPTTPVQKSKTPASPKPSKKETAPAEPDQTPSGPANPDKESDPGKSSDEEKAPGQEESPSPAPVSGDKPENPGST